MHRIRRHKLFSSSKIFNRSMKNLNYLIVVFGAVTINIESYLWQWSDYRLLLISSVTLLQFILVLKSSKTIGGWGTVGGMIF